MTMSWVVSAADAWWSWTAAMSIQITVFVATVAVLDRLLARMAWPQLLAALWLLVIVKLLLPPTISSPIGIARLGLGEDRLSMAVASTGVMDWPLLALLGWLLGVIAFLAYGVHRYRRLRHEWLGQPSVPAAEWFEMLVRNTADRLGIARAPRVCLKRNVRGPAVIGFLRPVVVIPADLLTSARRAQIEHVLLHELAHVKRRDPLWSFLCLGVQLVYWFHPLVWLAARRLATLREICCDQTVARLLGEGRAEYRRTLLHLARPLLNEPTLGHLGFLHRPSQVLGRLAWLERPLPHRPWVHRVITAVTAGLLLVCCVPMAQSTGATVPPQIVSVSALPSKAPDLERVQNLPALDELSGCLQLRFAVFGMLGREEQRASKL